MEWKIWYNDGTIVSGNSVQEWIDAPATGVLGVYELVGWSNGLKMSNLHCYGDWYWLTEDGSFGQSSSIDTHGTFVEPNNPPNSILKQGGMTGDTEMSAAYSLMLTEAWVEAQNGN